MTRRYAFALALSLLSFRVGAQSPRSDAGVEEIVILRSLLLSRIAPTDFCAAARVGFSANAEDRYDFKPVATDPASGKVTNASGARAGTLHACFGPTSDSLIASFYAEGDVGGVSLVGRGQCRMTKGDFWIRWRPADDKHARIAHAPWTRHRSTGLHASVDRYGPPVEDAIEAAAHVIS